MTKTPTLCCLNFVLYVGCINVLYACCILCLVWICSFFTFSFTVFFNKRNGSRFMWASSWHLHDVSTCCIKVSYVCCIFCVLFLKEKNHLITGERNIEERWLGLGLGFGLGLLFILYFSVLYFSCCIFPYYIYSLDSELILTMWNIDVT